MDTQKKKHIPDFESYEEEAGYWGTHDSTKFEWEPIKMTVSRPLKVTYAIRLEPQTVEKIREIAANMGIGPTTLARMWILEKLHEHTASA
ncbi:MAG: CopG family antitoxin [Anaerolineae bacterium]|nr:CopG family antitoxin [Anaerolineae bacterium]